MKKLLSIIILALVLTLAVGAETLPSTKVRGGTADPHLFTDGEYYYLAKTGNTRIAVYKADSISGLASAADSQSIAYCPYYNGVVYDPTIEALYGEGATINGTWSPEIHYFSEEDFGAEYAGWYMFVGLRMTPEADSIYSSEYVRLVVLKALTDDPAGPYGHPTEGIADYSQPLLNADGDIYDEWACGQSILRIPEGEYAGIYAMWVDEVGRGTDNFYQQIRISKMTNPWTLSGAPGTVTRPTQAWEFVGSEDGTHPAVVEGATAVYGRNGEVFLTYSGSGYWTDYGIGQLTWNGGDPLLSSSWVKYKNNPIFTATTAKNLRGAGHASFLTDESGNGFFCYHAYTYSAISGKGSSRAAYLEPYSIDYTAANGVDKGVLCLGNGVAADTSTSITFDTDGEALAVSEISLVVSLGYTAASIPLGNADGFILYRAEENGNFTYLATINEENLIYNDLIAYLDMNVSAGKTYTYRAYPYRNEEIGTTFTEATVTLMRITPPSVSLSATESGSPALLVYANDNYDGFIILRENGFIDQAQAFTVETPLSLGESILWTDDTAEAGRAYDYSVLGYRSEQISDYSAYVTVDYPVKVPTPTLQTRVSENRLFVGCIADTLYDRVQLYRSTDGTDFTEWEVLEDFAEGAIGLFRADRSIRYGNTYYYYAIGYLDGVASAPSETVSRRINFLPTPNITSCSYTCLAITLGWEGGADGDCHLLRSTDGGETFTEIAVITDGAQEYTDSTVTVGTEYIYKLQCTSESLGLESGFDEFIPIEPEHRASLGMQPAKAATCTEDGYTAYSACRYCGTAISGKETIPATGHNHVMIAKEIPATATSEGKTAVYTCSGCGDSYGGDVIPMLREAGSGDANGDGKTTLLDLVATLRYICDPTRKIDTAAADKNGDGQLTLPDVLLTLQAILNGEV